MKLFNLSDSNKQCFCEHFHYLAHIRL